MRKDVILILVIVATLALMVLPLSQSMIDLLLSINISLAVLLLLVAVYLKHPSDFSTFPSVILLGTAFRLALSVGTTRLILSEADAGQIIETFGEFVVSGSIVIGLVIFLIITVVQFLVVTKGAERVAEVGARFALDALPGKQMSIDAEVRAGNLESKEAAALRKRLDKDSQFFGAMDGAMKFVKGDAIAGLIIICINLIGGVAVGITLHGYTFGEAIGIFSLLTVGDGLVAQIPALLMSLCAGVIVTRVANQDNADLGTDIGRELVADPRVPMFAATIVLAVGFIPGFPTATFALISATLLVSAIVVRRALRHSLEMAEAEEQKVTDESEATDLPLSTRFQILIAENLADAKDIEKMQADLANHFEALHAAGGVLFPIADLLSDSSLPVGELKIVLDEVPIYRGTIPDDSLFVFNDGSTDIRSTLSTILDENSDGEDSLQSYGSSVLDGFWMPSKSAKMLENAGFTCMTPQEVVVWTGFRLYEQNLGSLFSLPVFKSLLAALVDAEPETMELINEEMTEVAQQKMFRYLIEDGVPMRPISLVASALHNWIHTAENPTSVVLAECLRGSLKRQLCYRIAGAHGVLGVALVDPELEAIARDGLGDNFQITPATANNGLVFEPELSEALLAEFRELSGFGMPNEQQVALVISADLRRLLRNFLASNNIHIPVLSPHEIAIEVPSMPVGLVRVPARSLNRMGVAPKSGGSRPISRAQMQIDGVG